MSKNKIQHAFTLIELLVVISIIGVLISLAVAGFSNAQRKGRDARRKEDLKAVQTALEQYYVVNGSYIINPDLTSLENYVADMTSGDDYLPGGAPVDPRNTGTYVYTVGANDDAYCVCAEMESMPGNASGAAISHNCSFGGDLSYFCVKNLQ
jgi:general secretion pathway protein G